MCVAKNGSFEIRVCCGVCAYVCVCMGVYVRDCVGCLSVCLFVDVSMHVYEYKWSYSSSNWTARYCTENRWKRWCKSINSSSCGNSMSLILTDYLRIYIEYRVAVNSFSFRKALITLCPMYWVYKFQWRLSRIVCNGGNIVCCCFSIVCLYVDCMSTLVCNTHTYTHTDR